ncbi:MAG: hypothetical protein ACRDYX_19975 [Egibacteraceae bacterium]
MTLSGDAAQSLRRLLRESTPWADDQWRRWARELLQPDALTVPLLAALWREVLAFDIVLAGHVTDPVGVPSGTVVVAGSGKETFKTFNVSTAASILAASCGAKVVKGVSQSVSAVSGAADVLDALGVPIGTEPSDVPGLLGAHGIAFISYAAFCPTYASRYDGVFRFLSPFSFFMPVAVLCVRAVAFIYGLAHPNVRLAATVIQQARPDLPSGLVVSTELAPGEIMDERASFGTVRMASLTEREVQVAEEPADGPSADWRRAVAHRRTHRDNAAVLAAALAPDGRSYCAALVEENAALILRASRSSRLSGAEALAAVRESRASGRADRLLSQLRSRRQAVRA